MTEDVAHAPMSRKRWFLLLGLWTLGVGAALMLIGIVAVLVADGSVPSWLRAVFPLATMCILVGLTWLIVMPFVSNEPMDRAHRRYMRQALPAFAGYALAMTLLTLVRDTGLPTWARALLAMLPVLPIGWVIWALWDYIQHCDELERRVQIEATYLTCGIVALITFAGGMLQHMGVLELKGALLHVLPLMFGVYGVAGWWCRRKYGLRGIC